jgi:hypothetical protein
MRITQSYRVLILGLYLLSKGYIRPDHHYQPCE